MGAKVAEYAGYAAAAPLILMFRHLVSCLWSRLYRCSSTTSISRTISLAVGRRANATVCCV